MLIGLWITTGCNLKCRYCYEGAEKQYENMSFAMADKVIGFIKRHYKAMDNEPLVIEFHGGEPLLNYKLIPYLVEKIESNFTNALFGVTTNGLLLNDENINYLSDKMSYGLSISIDGIQFCHDKNRIDCLGNGTYMKVAEKIPAILKKCRNIRARMTYTPDTVDFLSESIFHLIYLGFTNIVSAPDYFSDDWSAEKMDILLAEMIKVRNNYSRYVPEGRKVSISLLEDRFRDKGICQGGKTNFHILPNGDIYPCSYGAGNNELKLGNIMEEEIDTNKIIMLEEMNQSMNSMCEGCTGYPACISGRCKIFNKVIMGDFLQPSPVICAIQHVKLKFFDDDSK